MDNNIIITELAGKLDEMLSIFVQEQKRRGYWHLEDLEDAVAELRKHFE